MDCKRNVVATSPFFCFCTCLKILFTNTFLKSWLRWKVEIVSIFPLRTNVAFFLNQSFLCIHIHANKVSHYYMAYEGVYVTIGNPAFWLFLYLTDVHFRRELQHGSDVSQQKIKCWPIRTRETGGVSLSDVLCVIHSPQ